MSAETQPIDDLDNLRAALTSDIERISETLLGAPNKSLSTKRQLRWGAKGSLSVELQGRKRGNWFSHEAGQGGGPFNLIMHARGGRFADAVQWARTWTNTGTAPRSQPRLATTQHDAEEAAERERAIQAARRLAHAAVPVTGTTAETYLVMERAIPCPPTGWPDAIRYHAPTRSLLAVATLADGAVQAVQRVHLTPGATKAAATPDRPAKVTNGVQLGALVRLPAREDCAPALSGVLLLAEGPENGLTVWAATGCATWFVFGVSNFRNVKLPAGCRVILCRDDDREHSQADKQVRAAVTTWRKAGGDISVATPWADRRQDKSDFNDALQAGGADAVLARILPHAPTQPKPPSSRVPVETARAVVDAAVREFFQAAAAFDSELAAAEGVPPPVHGVRVGVGIGKSHVARRYAVDLLAELRTRGDRRNVVLAVPTHRLGAEQADILEALPEFQAAGLRVATWRGRTALDPEHPDFDDAAVIEADKASMCRNLEAVFEAQAHSLNVQETACRRAIKDGEGGKVVHECPLFSECAYQTQRKRRADLWLVAHEMLFTGKPTTIGELAAVVVDESPWQDGLEGHEGRGDRLPLDALRGTDKRPGDGRDPSWLTLQYHRTRALDALDALTDGPLTREAMQADSLTAKDAAEARALNLKRIVEPVIWPGMPKAQRMALLKEAEGNRARLQEGRFWRAVEALLADGGPAASGWAELAETSGQDGPQRTIRLQGRKPVRTGWQVPTLLIDALLAPDLVRPFWPQVQLVADVQAETPHQRIRQVIDRAYSKNRLEPLDPEKAGADPTEARRRTRALREARAIVCREARKHRSGKVLVVAQKAVREALHAIGPLPRNIELAHHNAVAGRDEWGNVACLIVLGRCAPSPRAVERMAEALTGTAVPPIEAGRWYPRRPTTREMADGQAMTAEADTHPDALCEAIRWQICEGELVQIIGRGRGVNRTAANPLDVLAMVDVPLPLPVHQALGFADLAPSLADQMLAECGFAFTTPRHAAAACPTLFPSWEAAKKALDREAKSRGQKGTNPYRYIPIGECPLLVPELRQVDYQRAGERQSPAVAWFDPLTVADFDSALTDLLGPLAWCRVSPDSVPEPPGPGLSVVADASEAEGAAASCGDRRPGAQAAPDFPDFSLCGLPGQIVLPDGLNPVEAPAIPLKPMEAVPMATLATPHQARGKASPRPDPFAPVLGMWSIGRAHQPKGEVIETAAGALFRRAGKAPPVLRALPRQQPQHAPSRWRPF